MKGGCERAEITIQRIRSLQEFADIKETWNALLAESPTNSYFLTWEWLWAWWNAYKEGRRELCILLVSKQGRLIGIAPLYLLRLNWNKVINIRRLMFLGTLERSVISEYMDLIYAAGEEESVVRSVIAFIGDHDLCDDIAFQMIETSSLTIPCIKKEAVSKGWLFLRGEEKESPYIQLPRTYEDFLGSLSRSMRYSIKRNEAKLKRYPDCVFRKTGHANEFATDYQELVRLHQTRWESRGMQGSFIAGKFPVFQRMVMQDMLKKGNLQLWFLSIRQRNVAVLYNIKYNDKIYFFQGGLDPAFEKGLAAGMCLHRYCIEQAIHEGLKEYDFLLMGATDSYKKRWASSARFMADIYMARPGVVKCLVTIREKARMVYHGILH